MTISGVVGIVALALLEGALVALPKANALEQLRRKRSAAWATALPGSILVGTFGVQALPPLAVALVALADVATPLLAAVAIFKLVRCPRAAILPIAVGLVLIALLSKGWPGELSASMVTGLGCLTIGVALVRLIPRRLLLAGVVAMCVLDVTLLALGAGQSAAVLMTQASSRLPGPVFAHATAGPITTDYPDLVLAAVLGGFVSGDRVQRGAAAIVAISASGYGMFLPLAGALPATVPIAVTFLVLALGSGRFPRPVARPRPCPSS
jgi:hypothetical protein